MQAIEGPERNRESCEPLACFRKVRGVHCQAGINPALQMGLKCGEDTVRVYPAHFVAAHLPGERAYQFQFDQRANRPFAFFGQRALRSLAQGLRAVIGGQHARVDVSQYRLLWRASPIS